MIAEKHADFIKPREDKTRGDDDPCIGSGPVAELVREFVGLTRVIARCIPAGMHAYSSFPRRALIAALFAGCNGTPTSTTTSSSLPPCDPCAECPDEPDPNPPAPTPVQRPAAPEYHTFTSLYRECPEAPWIGLRGPGSGEAAVLEKAQGLAIVVPAVDPKRVADPEVVAAANAKFMALQFGPQLAALSDAAIDAMGAELREQLPGLRPDCPLAAPLAEPPRLDADDRLWSAMSLRSLFATEPFAEPRKLPAGSIQRTLHIIDDVPTGYDPARTFAAIANPEPLHTHGLLVAQTAHDVGCSQPRCERSPFAIKFRKALTHPSISGATGSLAGLATEIIGASDQGVVNLSLGWDPLAFKFVAADASQTLKLSKAMIDALIAGDTDKVAQLQPDAPSALVLWSIVRANCRGQVVVAAAGNAKVTYPGAFGSFVPPANYCQYVGLPGDPLSAKPGDALRRSLVYAVGGIDSASNILVYPPNVSPDSLAFVAPGRGVPVYSSLDGWELMNGSSSAAASVSGALTLLWTYSTGASGHDVVQSLYAKGLPMSGIAGAPRLPRLCTAVKAKCTACTAECATSAAIVDKVITQRIGQDVEPSPLPIDTLAVGPVGPKIGCSKCNMFATDSTYVLSVRASSIVAHMDLLALTYLDNGNEVSVPLDASDCRSVSGGHSCALKISAPAGVQQATLTTRVYIAVVGGAGYWGPESYDLKITR